MSQENAEHARRGYTVLSTALTSSDLGPLRRLVEERFDPEVTIEPAGVFPETGRANGSDGALWLFCTPGTGWWCRFESAAAHATPASSSSSSASTSGPTAAEGCCGWRSMRAST